MFDFLETLTSGSRLELGLACLAAAAGAIGYLVNQHYARRDQRARSYADALLAITRLQELPYRIRRRTSDDAATRSALADLTRTVQGGRLLPRSPAPLGQSPGQPRVLTATS